MNSCCIHPIHFDILHLFDDSWLHLPGRDAFDLTNRCGTLDIKYKAGGQYSTISLHLLIV